MIDKRAGGSRHIRECDKIASNDKDSSALSANLVSADQAEQVANEKVAVAQAATRWWDRALLPRGARFSNRLHPAALQTVPNVWPGAAYGRDPSHEDAKLRLGLGISHCSWSG